MPSRAIWQNLPCGTPHVDQDAKVSRFCIGYRDLRGACGKERRPLGLATLMDEQWEGSKSAIRLKRRELHGSEEGADRFAMPLH
jgi:hypothetical protein